MKLDEGNSYNFSVIKIVHFEGKDFFLLEGPDIKRYLLPVTRYANYDIAPGKSVLCRIDRINCKGELFLEPEHPLYRENESYLFEVSGRDIRVDRAGNRHNVFIVKDVYGNDISIPAFLAGDTEPVAGEKISLVIERIVKGNIIFSGIDDDRHTEKEEDEAVLEFLLEEEVKGLDGRNYFLASDPGGAHYTLPADYYRHYSLTPGNYFQGRFVRYKAGEEVRVEPVNPFFSPGKWYPFTVVEMLLLTANDRVITVVKDEFGYNHNLDGSTGFAPGSKILLAVERIRKGWPLLKAL